MRREPPREESCSAQPAADVFDWHHPLIGSAAVSQPISFNLPLVLLESHTFSSFFFFFTFLSATPPEKASLSSLEFCKRWWVENEVSWFRRLAANDGKLQCRRQWLEARCASARGRGEQREEGWKRLHHQLAPTLITPASVCLRAHIHAPLCLSGTLSSAISLALSFPQMWEMKRIGGVVFKCGNALAKSATSINTATCVQYTWACMHEHSRTHTHTRGKHYATVLLLLEIVEGGVKHGFKGLLSTFFYIIHICLQCIPRLRETRAQEDESRIGPRIPTRKSKTDSSGRTGIKKLSN